MELHRLKGNIYEKNNTFIVLAVVSIFTTLKNSMLRTRTLKSNPGIPFLNKIVNVTCCKGDIKWSKYRLLQNEQFYLFLQI